MAIENYKMRSVLRFENHFDTNPIIAGCMCVPKWWCGSKQGYQWTHKNIGDLYNQNLKGDDSFDMFWHIPKSLKQRGTLLTCLFWGPESTACLWRFPSLVGLQPLNFRARQTRKTLQKKTHYPALVSELPGTSSETGIILWRTVLAADCTGLKGSPTIPDPELVTHQLSVTRTLAARSWPTKTLQFQARSCISLATGKPTSSSNSWDYDWEIVA